MKQELHSEDCNMTEKQFVAWLRALADAIESNPDEPDKAADLGEHLLCLYDTPTEKWCRCETPENHQ